MQMTLTIVAENPAELVTVLTALQGAGVGEPIQLKAGGHPAVLAAAEAANKPVVEQPPKGPEYGPEKGPKEMPSRPRGRPPKSADAPAPAPKLKVVETPKVEPEVIDPPKAKDDPPAKTVTLSDVRTALTEFLQANDEPTAAALLSKHGHTDRLSRLEPQYFAAVYAAAVTPAAKTSSAAPFDDDISGVGTA